MNKIKRILCATLFFIMAFSWSSFSQYAVGDYITICLGAGPTWDWSGAPPPGSETWGIVTGTGPLTYTATATNPVNTKNAFIRTGHTVNLNASGPYQCLTLTVETGGKLWTDSPIDVYLELYGTSLVCDGQIGNGATFNAIGFTFEGANCTVTGTGTFDASRIRKNRTVAPAGAVVNSNVTFSRNINLHWPSSADIYNNSAVLSPGTINTNFNVTVSAGDTLSLLGNAAIDSANGVGASNDGGTFTINGTMIIGGRLYLTTNNTTNICKWIVGPGGYLSANRIVASPAAGVAKDSLRVDSLGTLEISGDSAWISPVVSGANNVYAFASGSTVIYSSSSPTGNQEVRGNSGAADLGAVVANAYGNSYGNLILSGAGTKFATKNIRLKNDLIISSPVKFAPNALSTNQIGGNWINYNDTGFTEGTSNWQFNGAANQTITTPGGEVFYTISYRKTADTLIFNSPIDIINQLVWGVDGLIDLNSNTLTIRNAATSGIQNADSVRYIISEKTDNSSKITWKIGTTGAANQTYVFPFGNYNGDYLPVTEKVVTSGTVMGDVTISTYGTIPDNTPWPVTPDLVTNFNIAGTPAGTTNDSDAAVDRFWQVNATGGGAADLTFTYPAAELPAPPYNVATEMRAQYWRTDSSFWNLPSTGSALGFTVTVTGNNNYGPWALSNINSPLPVQLIEFDAKLRGDVVDVNWTTASEINNDYFTVEKTKDGKTFAEVGRVRGSGNTTELHSYALTDPNPFSGHSYYRLRQTDYDGHYSYSGLVPIVYNNKNSSWYIFPNPATDRIYVANNNDDLPNAILQLFNPEGALIKSISLDAKSQSILSVDISEFSNGIYIGKITDDYHQEIFKIVKN